MSRRSYQLQDRYDPAEDTFFLHDIIKHESGKTALDVGTGSGYLASVLEKNFDLVISTDINFNALIHKTYHTKNTICCDVAQPLGISFDLIVCNMPYLATSAIEDVATDGGAGGLEVPLHIIKSVIPKINKDGKFIYITSSLSDYDSLIRHTRQLGLDTEIIAKKKLFYETLMILSSHLRK